MKFKLKKLNHVLASWLSGADAQTSCSWLFNSWASVRGASLDNVSAMDERATDTEVHA